MRRNDIAPGFDPTSPVPPHPRSVTLPYSKACFIDRPLGLNDVVKVPGVLAGYSWSHAPMAKAQGYQLRQPDRMTVRSQLEAIFGKIR